MAVAAERGDHGAVAPAELEGSDSAQAGGTARLVGIALVAAALVTMLASQAANPRSPTDLAFLATWLAAALVVAWRGRAERSTVIASVLLVAFPMMWMSGSIPSRWFDPAWTALGSISLVLFLYTFPQGTFLGTRWAVTFLASATYLTVRAVRPELVGSSVDDIAFLGAVAVPLCLQAFRNRRASNPIDRQRQRIVLLGLGTAIAGMVALLTILRTGIFGTQEQAEAILGPSLYSLVLLIPLAVAVAKVPLPPWAGRAMTWLAGLARDDPARTLSLLGAQLQSGSPVDQVLPAAAGAIAKSLRLPFAAVEINGGPETRRRWETAGEPTGTPVRWAVGPPGRVCGELIAVPRAGEHFTPTDLEVLGELSRQLVPILRTAQISIALDVVRTQLVAAREEERRRLRADLHDELGATLSGLILKAGVTSATMATDSIRAQLMLREIEASLRDSVATVRRLVEGLRPPELDERGLVAAIRECAENLSAPGGMIITVRNDELPPLPAAVELAAYRIVQEALTNAVRHSGGSRAGVDVRGALAVA